MDRLDIEVKLSGKTFRRPRDPKDTCFTEIMVEDLGL